MQADAGALRDAIAALRTALDDTDLTALGTEALIGVADDLETLRCQLPAHDQRVLAQLQRETSAVEMGAKSWRDVLAVRWRISTGEASQRLTRAAVLGPRHALTGESLAPVLEAVAVAQRLGFLTPEHVDVLRKGIARIPGWVEQPERDQLHVDWVRHGVGGGPKELKDQIDRTLFLLDQDGTPPDDEERQRRRAAALGPQRHDGMSEFTATLTPESRAVWEVLMAKYAAPGMCNPADEHPCVTGTPSQAQIDGDTRTSAQRRHDALLFIGRHGLDKGELGQLNGLPTSILIRTTLQDLISRTGLATTGGGTVMPIADVLQMAAQQNTTNYLGVFEDATHQILDFYRSRRTASAAQRLAIILRDGGCTKPGCPVHAYGSQVHHTVADWCNGGRTNVNEMSLACGGDNRLVGPGGWTTTMNETHDTEWHPPPRLDTGQNRVNHYHHPEQRRPPDQGTWTPHPPTTGDVAPTEPSCLGEESERASHVDVDSGSEGEAGSEGESEIESPPNDRTPTNGATTQPSHPPGGPDPPLAA